MPSLITRLALLALLAPAAAPVLAQEAFVNDGVINIVGDPEVQYEAYYGTARGWEVHAGFTGAGFAYCAAEMSGPDGAWRFGYDTGPQWQMAFAQPVSGETAYGTFDVDGHGSGITGWGNGSWVTLWLGRGEYDAISTGNRLSLSLGMIRRNFALSGTAAAALKVQECVQNAGTAPQQAAPAQRPSGAGGPVMPALSSAGEQFVGNCRTPYVEYRCMATTLTPTGGFGEAMLVEDGFGSEPRFVVQTNRADLSQVWAMVQPGAPWAYLGEWESDGTCRRPRASQPPAVISALGHDAWELCIQ